MGFQNFEAFQQPSIVDFLRNWPSPVKTEPDVLRGINEIISMQVLTHQLLTQLATGKVQSGQAFIGQGQRANEGAAFDESVGQVRLLSQRVDELERKLDEATKKAGAAAGGATRG
jgi:hypothetical protein